jgi:TfoX/Sxy family transcriptional regulator of competence genes
MAYSEESASRVRGLLKANDEFIEKKLFGGLCFMTNGNMFCGIINDSLVVRVGKEAYEDALARPGVKPMDFTGRPLSGFVYVEPKGYSTEESLLAWVNKGLKFASSLPPK